MSPLSPSTTTKKSNANKTTKANKQIPVQQNEVKTPVKTEETPTPVQSPESAKSSKGSREPIGKDADKATKTTPKPKYATLAIDKIVIRDEYKDFWDPLAEDEKKLLEKKIGIEGFNSRPTVMSSNGECVLLDGHHRLAILKDMKVKTVEVKYAPSDVVDDRTALEWIYDHQRARRNPTPKAIEVRDQRIRRLYEQFKAESYDKTRNLKNQGQPSKGSHEPVDKNGKKAGEIKDAATRTADATGVSKSTVKRVVGKDKPKPAAKSAKASNPLKFGKCDKSTSMIRSFKDIGTKLNAMLEGKPPMETANVLAEMDKVEVLHKKVRRFVEK